MKAVLCRDFAPYSGLKVEEVENPVAGEGMVIVDVKAAGVNFPDILLVEGKYQMKPPLPFIPGGECAGVISEVGPGVKGFKAGDRVRVNFRKNETGYQIVSLHPASEMMLEEAAE